MTAPSRGGVLSIQLLHLDSLTLDKLELDALASWLKLLSLPTRKELRRGEEGGGREGPGGCLRGLRGGGLIFFFSGPKFPPKKRSILTPKPWKMLRPENRVFLNLGFGEPMFCTPDSCGFRHFRAFRHLRESSNQPPCLWLSELSSSFSSFS